MKGEYDMSVREGYNNGEFCWVDLATPDLGAALKFYEQVFGWQTEPQKPGDSADHGGYTMFQHDGHIVAGAMQFVEQLQAAGVPAFWNSYINVPDIAAATDKARQLGAEIHAEPQEVPGVGWYGYLKDPTGAGVGLWQATNFRGATRVNDPGYFCWNELATRDMDKARDFYAEMFGWEYQKNEHSPSRYDMIMNAGRANGGIMEMTAEWGDIPPYWGVYFSVTAANDTAQRIKSAGGKLHCEPFDIPIGKIAVAADSTGAPFSIIQMSEQPD
jgi:predicted enzyme related to lactoylglutathione lyase